MADILSAKMLREERAPLAVQIKDLNDKAQAEQRAFNAEEEAKWDALNRDYNLLTSRIGMAERAEQIILEQVTPIDQQRSADGQQRGVIPGRENFDGRQTNVEDAESRANASNPGAPSEEQRALAIQGWMRAQRGMDLRPEHARACELTGIRPHMNQLDLGLRRDSYANVRREFRSLSAQTGATGNFTINQGFVNNLEMALLQFGGMRQVSDVMRTSQGNDMPWPTSNDSSNKGVLVGESTNPSTLDPTFGQTVFRAYKWSSKFILVPYELLEDSAFDLASTLGTMLGERLGRIQNQHFTTGTSVGQPNGVVTAATTFAAAAAASISFDDIIGLQHSVDPAYRNGAAFMCHDTILGTIRKLKDGQGRYLWSSGTQVGAPDTINGAPIITNQDMASSIASAAKTLLYGQFSKYKIRDVGEIRLRRLVERYADVDQEGFVAFARGDGNLLDAGTRPVKVLAHP
jgi:HK97 family phage major capsid protein